MAHEAPARLNGSVAAGAMSARSEDWKIQRVFLYTDPDYAGKDTGRYAWLADREISS
jgi:hypothetical protein